MRSVRISWKTAQTILSASAGMYGFIWAAIRDELQTAMKPKRSVKAARVRKTAKRATKKEETAAIREAVMRRAEFECEGCGGFADSTKATLELDHFFGRVRAKQSERNCWVLCRGCHREKTNNIPSAAFWLEAFAAHSTKHGYAAEARLARNRLQALALSDQAAALSREAQP